MRWLPPIECPECHRKIESIDTDQRPGTAMGYESCHRFCTGCGLGFSNASTDDVGKLRRIYQNPFGNVPDYIAEGHQQVLDRALNERHRKQKKLVFASEISEDHVTWTV